VKSNQLTDIECKNKKKRGRYCDGGGLYLQVNEAGNKSWIFRYRSRTTLKIRDMGLGRYPKIKLSEAREMADAAWKLHHKRIDPIDHRNADINQQRAAATQEKERRGSTLLWATEMFIKDQNDWSQDHKDKWLKTIKKYVNQATMLTPVADVDDGIIFRILDPIWNDKPETASRIRQKLEGILDWARVKKKRTGDNPARWKGQLEHVYSKPKANNRHAALPYKQMSQFMRELTARDGIAVYAFRFTILTVARTTEALQAQWAEISFKDKVWTIPAGRMKMEKAHVVPLTEPAIEILREMEQLKRDEFIFPSTKTTQPLSDEALRAVVKRMNQARKKAGQPLWVDPKEDNKVITPHGFRSTFTDWRSEETHYAREVSEMALAHAISSDTEAAYRRGTLFKKRKLLMAKWANYCMSPPTEGKVLKFGRKANDAANL
jgi:integrase